MTQEEIINLLKEQREDARDIEHVPVNPSSSEKVILLQFLKRQELSKALGLLIEMIEGKRPAEGKPTKYEVLP